MTRARSRTISPTRAIIGVGKYVDEEQLIELMPGMEEDITAASNPSGGGSELTSGSDRDSRWFQSNGDFKQVRLVDIWYKSKGGWKWALFTGSKILMQGQSPFKDEYGQPICKYLMFSASVDHDGDRYGIPRNLMSPQDEVNQRRSKALHELNNRRIIATKAAIADTNVEAIRREAARADGIVLVNTSLQDVQFDDQAKQAAVMGQLEFMRNAAQEIENFGPNGMIAGSAANGGINPNSSGRAIALMQQAGLAELGPLHAQPARLENAGLSRAVQRRAIVLDQSALDQGDRRRGRSAIRADQHAGLWADRRTAGEKRDR